MDEVKIGQAASFRINGFGEESFAGTVRRIDATANATTRQVEVVVAFADPAKAPRVAGLYAEGRIAAAGGGGAAVMRLAEPSIVRNGNGTVHVWRVKDGHIAKVAVQIGERDVRSGEFELKAGLSEGDQILRNPGTALVDGQRVEFAKATAAAAASAPSK
jgi:multidrug efflux pump subunit AcrA (membrane-fusion protein)